MNIPFLKSTSIYFTSQVEKLNEAVTHGVDKMGENITERTETFMETIKKWKDFSEGMFFDFFKKLTGNVDEHNLLTIETSINSNTNNQTPETPIEEEETIMKEEEEEDGEVEGEEPSMKKRKRDE